MTFAEIGDMLRTERLRRNQSLEEVADLLKLSPRLIRGIEAGDESALPHTVYVRGFVRSYARLLEIELESIAEQPIIFATEAPEPGIQTRPMPQPSRSNWGLRLLVLVCALGFAGYWYYHTQLSAPQAPVAVPSESGAQGTPHSAAPASSFNPLNSDNPANPANPGRLASLVPSVSSVSSASSGTSAEFGASGIPGASTASGTAASSMPMAESGSAALGSGAQAAQSGQPGLTQAAQMQAYQQAQAAAQAQQALSLEHMSDESLAAREEAAVSTQGFSTNTLEVPVSGGTNKEAVRIGVPVNAQAGEQINQILLTGVAECWVHTTADGTETRQFSIQSGETFSLSFSKSLLVKLGNAGGVRMKYNGKELPAPGKDGQVLTLQFPQAAGQ